MMSFFRYLIQKLTPFFIFFMILEFCVRIALIGYKDTDVEGMGFKIPESFLVGMGFDFAVFLYLALPVLFFSLFIPRNLQGTKTDALISSCMFFVFSYVLLFCAVGEWFFWDEFQSRYNFIAVDYLVYTQEVIGNIRESYPVGLLMTAMAVASFFLSWVFYRSYLKSKRVSACWKGRGMGITSVIVLCLLSFTMVKSSHAEISDNRYLNEIARNGIFELFSAYRNNALDYDKFYKTLSMEDIAFFLREKLNGKESGQSPLDRPVKSGKKARPYNLVLITVESLSAEFLAEFGEKNSITPNLDKLIPKSLFFSNLYATGTRTVYGLSAITLGMPPIPGNSIVRRPENSDMFSIGHVLKSKGYATKFIYGGYGYFDNMNSFFENNGYEIVDRNKLTKEEIRFANIWGVADDDLYRRVLKENDKAHREGRPFFDMVMTTSNHRPYTFPEGKIDLPSKSGRWGGVKFTDFAVDEFLNEAKKRAWFKDTIFVIVADHTAGSSGKSELDPKKYHIPMWIYAPGIIKPGKMDDMMSQIDIAPTILGLMNISYDSRFYGVDVLKQKPERAFISNYQQLGYLTKEGLVILKPVREAAFFTKNEKGEFLPRPVVPDNLLSEAIGYYQGASQWKEWSRQP